MSEASYPDGLYYNEEHDWARVDGDVATFGITWYAQDALGEVVFFDPPDEGTQIKANESYAEVESVKAVSDLYAPVGGKVVAINQAVVDDPASLNRDPYGMWLVKLEVKDPKSVDALLDAKAYQAIAQ